MQDGGADWQDMVGTALRRLGAMLVEVAALLLLAAVIAGAVWLAFLIPVLDIVSAIVQLAFQPAWVMLAIVPTAWVVYRLWPRPSIQPPPRRLQRPAFRWPGPPKPSAERPGFAASYFWTAYAAVVLIQLLAVVVLYGVIPIVYLAIAFVWVVGVAVFPVWAFQLGSADLPWMLAWWAAWGYAIYRIAPRLRPIWTFPRHRLLRFRRFTERLTDYLNARDGPPP